MESTEIQKNVIRSLVENAYDLQSVRVASGNRLVASLRSAGLVAPPKEDEQEDEEKVAKSIINSTVTEFNAISTIYAEKYGSRGSITKALSDSDAADILYIKTELIYGLVKSFVQLYSAEKGVIELCAKEVQKHPLWDAFFKDVKGCGPMMAAVCISYLDPYKARWPSSFWKYCGLDVVVDENGSHGRSRSDCTMVKYINKKGEEAEKRSLGYNPTIKTKLIGVLGSSFLRTGRDGKYASIYYDYKNRLVNRPDCADLRPVVIHKRAVRYMVKMFLKDLWFSWRTLEGLPTGEDYAVAKLGVQPHHDPRNNTVSQITFDDLDKLS